MSGNPPTPTTRELEIAATAILAEVEPLAYYRLALPYSRLHSIVAYAYGCGYAEGLRWSLARQDEAIARVRQALKDEATP